MRRNERVKPLPNAPEDEKTIPEQLTSGRVLFRSTVWNFIGQAIPFLIAIPALPVLVTKLGIERFGVLTLVWMVIGYFNMFDLGLGRSMTQMIAREVGKDADEKKVVGVVRSGLALMSLISLAGATIVWITAPWLVHSALNIPLLLQEETLRCLYIIAIAMPFIVVSSGLSGILSAYQRFDIINLIRTPMAVLTILLPVVLVVFTNRLEWIATILAIIRTGACVAYFVVCIRLVPWRKHRGGTDRLAVREFVRLGGWMTLSNVLNPFLVSLDRVIIVGLVSISAVAYYSTPLEIITKLSIVPGAIVGVLFPAFATTFVGDKNRTLFLLSQGTKYTFFALFLPVIATVIFADEVLRVWLGLEFAANSGRVLQILAVGVLINSLAYPAVALLQGVGLPEKVAIFHLFEIVIYLPILWFLTHHYGIVGTAVAWTLRVALDTTFLCSVALFQFPRKWWRLSHVMLPLLFFSALLITPFFMNEIIAKLCYFIASTILVFLVSWHFMLLHEEKKTISGYLRIAFEGITRK